MFGVIQNHKVCSAAKLQVDKIQYRQNEKAIRRLKPVDLLNATEEEKRRMLITNPAAQCLHQLVLSLRTKVPGTDESHTSMQSQISGPSSDQRAKNIVANPFTAAKFFHYIINAILEELFGIRVNRETGQIK